MYTKTNHTAQDDQQQQTSIKQIRTQTKQTTTLKLHIATRYNQQGQAAIKHTLMQNTQTQQTKTRKQHNRTPDARQQQAAIKQAHTQPKQTNM